MYCPDNYDAFCHHEAEQEKALSKLPECSECGEKIQEDDCYEFNGELFCNDCMDSHRVNTENYIKE
jgi:formylmethanofuran dehydrogenase subunit E